MAKQQKPFIAARIPTELENALVKYTELTGESKTTALINALSKYVGWPQDQDVPKEPNAIERLTLIEKRLKKLEEIAEIHNQQGLQQTSLKFDSVINDDNNSEEKLLGSKDVSAITGIPYNTVRKKPKAGKIAEGNGKKFKPVKQKNEWKWIEIT